MTYALLTAGAIAACCTFGAAIGFLFKNIKPAFEDILNGLAAGVMLCAAALGLVLPSAEFSGDRATWLPPLGIMCGAAFLTLIGRLSPLLTESMGLCDGNELGRSRAISFVAAIAIHHFPEGIAAGVSFGTGELGNALPVAAGIAFQNIPEAMIIVPPLLYGGMSKGRVTLVSVISGLVEVLGVFFGYFAISVSQTILPFALAFAAGTMLYVVVDNLVPQTHERSSGRLASFAALIGFCLMLTAREFI